MKKIILLISAVVLCTGTILAEDITGKWYGTAVINGIKLKIEFELEKSGDTYSGYMISPDQSSQKIPLSAVSYDGNELNASVGSINFAYKGNLNDDGSINGSFTQNGMTFSLPLSRTETVRPRPQNPVPPFPYDETEVSFRNEKDGITLYGTLTAPHGDGPFPAVVMVTGSGPQNRDEELLGHKPFLVIADYLTRKGIAVLRYDERGVGESEGNYAQAGLYDFADDAQCAVRYLKTIDKIEPGKTGVIGHSEGGAVAFILGSRKAADFIISMAAPGINGPDLLLAQTEAILKTSGVPQNYIDTFLKGRRQIFEMALADTLGMEEQIKECAKILAGTPEAGQEEVMIKSLHSPGLNALLKYDPAPDLQNISCPIFAINGGKDVQVPSKLNLPAIEKGIRSNGNRNLIVKEYEGLNHLFQTAKTGLSMEYGSIEETFNEKVMEDIAGWILSL